MISQQFGISELGNFGLRNKIAVDFMKRGVAAPKRFELWTVCRAITLLSCSLQDLSDAFSHCWGSWNPQIMKFRNCKFRNYGQKCQISKCLNWGKVYKSKGSRIRENKDLIISHTRFARGTPVKSPIGICIAEFNEAGGGRREIGFFIKRET